VNYAADKRLGTWGMYDKTRGDFIGSCLLRLFSDIEPRQIELGYSLERRYWGLGIGTEMAKAMVSHGFTGDIDEIVAVTILENIGSQRVLEKAGFKRGDNFIRNGDELAFFKMTKPAL
jgi:ribosomal-protein-alanine N-acetyltransferase